MLGVLGEKSEREQIKVFWTCAKKRIDIVREDKKVVLSRKK